MSYDEIFVEQLKSLGKPEDLLIIFSGSGKSMNIIKAGLWAKENNLRSIGILGFDGGYVKDFLDLSITVDSTNYGIIESVQAYIHHFIVEVLKKMKSERNL
jgi:D-sedoheptulose 7-phosphate isomerase